MDKGYTLAIHHSMYLKLERWNTCYYKEKSTGKGRTCLQRTQKLGCPAHIEVHVITLFPEYQLSSTDSMSGVKKLKDIKQKKLRELKSNLIECTSTVTSEDQYFVVLPTEEAHKNYHGTNGAASFAHRIHPKLVSKIYELVSEVSQQYKRLKITSNIMCCMFCVFNRSQTLQTELIFPLLLMSEITSTLHNIHANFLSSIRKI